MTTPSTDQVSKREIDLDSPEFLGRVIAAASEAMTEGQGSEWDSFIDHLNAWADSRNTDRTAIQPAATVIKTGADRQWMSESLGHLPDAAIRALKSTPAAPVASAPSDALRNIRDVAAFMPGAAVFYNKAENALAAIEGRDAVVPNTVASAPAQPFVNGDLIASVVKAVKDSIMGNSHPCDDGYVMFISEKEVNCVAEQVALVAASVPPPPAQQMSLEAERVNAARYRWLRSSESSLETRQRDKGIINVLSCYHAVGGVRELKSGEKLDVAIDAARAALATQQKVGD